MDVDMVVMALGTSPTRWSYPIRRLSVTRHGTVVADEQTGRTTKERVWQEATS